MSNKTCKKISRVKGAKSAREKTGDARRNLRRGDRHEAKRELRQYAR